MAQTFYFYDLETSSGSPRDGRIMQFAGQRTDENLEIIGEPDNILVRLADDVIPEPDAVLVHKITPQRAQTEGITEAEFAKFFQEKIATADTVFVGYNNIRFDDEFMRRVCYRTFYDPYQWHWKDGKSRWDLLDAMRMMRALRPEGLKWPMLDGKPTVKLELMAKENDLLHENAHDALSDVQALIQLAQKFKSSQPKLFGYLLNARSKKAVSSLVSSGEPFVYTSGKYSSEYDKTTVVYPLFAHPRREAAIVYNLRENPEKWFNKPAEELVKHWQVRYGDDIERLPVKTLQFNKCPAVAPMGVLDEESQDRLSVDLEEISKNLSIIKSNQNFISELEKALDIIENAQQTKLSLDDSVDNKIYDEFWVDSDQRELQLIRAAEPNEISGLITTVKNQRIRDMIPLYIARNFPNVLDSEQREKWEEHRQKVFYGGGEKSRFSKFSKRMQELGKSKLNSEQEYLLTELQLYAESVLPEPS